MINSKVSVEKFLVADGNAAVVGKAAATALVTDATGVVNLSDEQLGIFNADTGTGLNGASSLNAPRIIIAQGTENSATPFATPTPPLYIRAVEKSPVIDSSRPVTITKRAYDSTKTSSSWIIGEQDGQSDQINIADDTRYQLTIAFDGDRADLFNGLNQPAIFPEFTSPDYTNSTTYTTAVKRLDHLVCSLVAAINAESVVFPGRRGGANVVAFAIDSDAVDADNGIALGSIDDASTDVGTVVTVGYTSSGQRIQYTITAEDCRLFAAIIADATLGGIDTASRLVPVLLTTAPSGSQAATDVTATTTSVAGAGTQEADYIVITAIDQPLASYDFKPNRKDTITVGLSAGFEAAVQIDNVYPAFEGIGSGRTLELMYKATEGLRKFNSVFAPTGMTFEFPSDFDTTEWYTVYAIQHSTADVNTSGIPASNPFTTLVCIGSADTTTATDFELMITNWAAGNPNVQLNF